MFRLLNIFAVFILASGCVKIPGANKSIAPHGSTLKVHSYAKDTQITVTASKLNLRECPGTHCEIVKVLTKGTIVSVEESSGKWVKIIRKDDYISGWLYGDYVQLSTISSVNKTNRKSKHPDKIENQKKTSEMLSGNSEDTLNLFENEDTLLEDEYLGNITDEASPSLLEDNVTLPEENQSNSTNKKISDNPKQDKTIVEEFM